jgi:MFS family permease
VLRIGVVGFVGWGCLGGLSFLVALRAGDAFGLGASTRGVLLTSFGLAGLVTAHFVGHGVDRFGARRCVIGGATAGAVLVALTGVLPWIAVVGVLWALAGIACQFLLVGLNALVLSGDGANRSGSVSVVQALRFLGGAASPVAFVPLYHLQPAVSFVVPAGLLAATAPLALAHWHGGDGQARQQATA